MIDAPARNRSMTPSEWVMLIALSVLWGGSFFFQGVAVRELPPLTIVVARVGLAAATLWIALALMGIRVPGSRRVWMAFFGMGVLNNAIPFSLIVWGQAHIGSGLASILNAMTPLFSVIVAHLATGDEKLTPAKLFGVLAGIAGVTVMIGWQALGSLGLEVAAQLAVLGGALSYGFASVFGRRFRDLGVQPMATAAGQVTASALLLAPLMLMIDRPWTLAMPSMAAVGALVALAVLSTALAYILFFRILAGAGAVNISLVTFLIPPTAMALGIGFLDERLEFNHLIGLGLIGVGLAAIDGRMVARLRRTGSEPT
jgi:drug/metabolite transporter (DMT)-like permease